MTAAKAGETILGCTFEKRGRWAAGAWAARAISGRQRNVPLYPPQRPFRPAVAPTPERRGQPRIPASTGFEPGTSRSGVRRKTAELRALFAREVWRGRAKGWTFAVMSL